MHSVRIKALLLAGCSYILLVTACNSPAGRKWQRVFLDGVPPERPPAEAVALSAPLRGVPADPTPRAAPSGKDPALVVHPPYAKHECSSCHESLFSQKLVREIGELCQLCHQSVFAQAKFRHAPAEIGACLSCHHPHQSSEKALLILPGRQLCLQCHEEKDVATTVEHARIGQTACQVCHNPHGSDQRYFLKTGWQAAAKVESPRTP